MTGIGKELKRQQEERWPLTPVVPERKRHLNKPDVPAKPVVPKEPEREPVPA